jgi:hypothetical protein
VGSTFAETSLGQNDDKDAALVPQVAKIDGAPGLDDDVPHGSPLSDGELVATVQANVTVDWTARENVRAQLLACW